ncbi:DUF3870 domain-containing protein [Mesobacillus maritimus]|uniref:DUF3870 domain-containing protein n=1 Tax=Mesobacillus maritimus TaxID=1643336 RepID=UPI00204254A4|nr:DUF3870 domain-containing protein [Mesobacillus maritimus]MCM3588011.1 DUF3870 domain-containing protein [Mesobacillus maritimus]MCM3668341.1 DUF3870 domain-containing protein [Mesobacillus maritimus]
MVETMFIAGHSRLPAGMAAKNVYETLTITVELEKKYGVILEASCTLATEHGRDYIGRLLRGSSILHGVEELIEIVKKNYYGKATNAIIAALSDLHYQFQQIKLKS